MLVATLVFFGFFTVQANQDQLQKPIIAKQDVHETPFSDGLPKELSPEQVENLETEKYTFQVRILKKETIHIK